MAVLGAAVISLILGTAAWLLLRPPPASDVAAIPFETVAPTQSPEETETAEPTPRKKPARPIGREINVDALARQVSQLRELQLRRPLRSRALSDRALANKISDLAFSELDPDEVEADERLLIALRLAKPGFDLADIQERLYREQVLGVYVPKEQTLYVRSRGRATPAQRMTTAHEITHALQDQTYDIDRMQKRYEDEADAALAVLSLIEGDATLTQQLWAQAHLSAEELQQAMSDNATQGSALDEAPDYLRASLFFPYAQGGAFVATLYRDGGTDAVDKAFQDPPLTSEQILHPERYTERDDPVAVRVATAPPPAWKKSATYEFGEFDLLELLRPVGDDTAEAAAQGWDGGEVRSWVKGAQTTVAATLAFDSAADADEVCAALPTWYSAVADGVIARPGSMIGDRDAMALRCAGDRVHFALAPTRQSAKKLLPPP